MGARQETPADPGLGVEMGLPATDVVEKPMGDGITGVAVVVLALLLVAVVVQNVWLRRRAARDSS